MYPPGTDNTLPLDPTALTEHLHIEELGYKTAIPKSIATNRFYVDRSFVGAFHCQCLRRHRRSIVSDARNSDRGISASIAVFWTLSDYRAAARIGWPYFSFNRLVSCMSVRVCLSLSLGVFVSVLVFMGTKLNDHTCHFPVL